MQEKILKIFLVGIFLSAFMLMFFEGYPNNKGILSSYEGYEKMVALDGLVKSHLSQKNQRDYPEYFGGSYLHDDQHHLVVQVVKSNIPDSSDEEEYAIYEKLMNFDADIIYEYVDYSYTELERVDAYVKAYFDKVPMPDLNVTTIGIEIMKNRVVIGLSKNTSENRQKFKEQVIDSEVIEFEEANPISY